MNRYFGLHTLEGEWHALLPRYMILAERIKGARVLDIGCGTGIGSSLLLELGAEMVDAIDHRPAVLELGRMKHAKDGLDFHVMFWEELDFPDDTFDVVLCLDPSSPVTDPSLVQEVVRVLKPGGEYVCSVEKKTIDGLETVLPRYGYAESAESIDVHQSTDRVPQLGTLNDGFSQVTSVVQRPVYAFQFDRPYDDPAAAPNQTRKIDQDSENGVFLSEDSTVQEDRGRWMSVDMGLCAHDMEAGSVEIFFCTNGDRPSAPIREVHMPFYGVVERLKQVLGDLQEMQVRGVGDDESIFEEVVDDPDVSQTPERERQPTNEFKAVSWDEPTTIRERPDLRKIQSTRDDEVDDLSARVNELSDLYSSVKGEFQRVVGDANAALDERDRYIEHLVSRIHDWETRYFEQTSPKDPAGAAGDAASRVSQLEAEIARLRDEQRRLRGDLEQKAEFLAEPDDVGDTGEFRSLDRDAEDGEASDPSADADSESADSEDAVQDSENDAEQE